MSPLPGARDGGPERSWFDDDAAVEDQPADAAASLVSLGFFTAALRRSKWFWRVTAIVGLITGSGLYLRAPHPYQASTTLILAVGNEAQPGQAILEDQALAQSHTMAGLALHKLGLQESINSFLGSYTATPVTDRVLQITATAPSSNEAVRRANVLATAYLAFRATQLRAQQQLWFTSLDQQVTQEKQALRVQGNRASNDLTALEQDVISTKANAKVATDQQIASSKVLDSASPDPLHSRLKHLILYAAGGFIIGLILGMIIIVVRALLSDRLRRRDDVAQALGAPVKLSVPTIRLSWLPGRRGRVSDRSTQRIVAFLHDAVPAGSRSAAALAVVPVDDPQAAALSVVSLAESYAREGRRVVVADLCGGAPAAMLLGAKGPGVHTVSVRGTQLVTAVPDPAEFAPVGPLRPASPRGAQPAFADELATSVASADLLLTLITLDPSVGGEYLATWAPEAVVMVTAGRSSWTKIHAVGEMIRLAGTRLVCAVLIGADKTDESLGVTPTSEAGRDAVTTQGVRARAEGSLARDRRGRSSGPDAVMAPGMQADASFAAAPVGEPFDESRASRSQMDPPEHMGHRRRTGR